MKAFRDVQFDPVACREELIEFKALLDSADELEERKDILRFFSTHHQLSVFLCSLAPRAATYDRVAHEYDLFGDFACDLVAGDGGRGVFCFVEFEDARSDSVFRQVAGKATKEWSPRFNHGFSQLVDWYWKLEDLRQTQDFRTRFGVDRIHPLGVLVVGRTQFLAGRERDRLSWRLSKVLIDSQQILCMTYDELYENLAVRLRAFGQAVP